MRRIQRLHKSVIAQLLGQSIYSRSRRSTLVLNGDIREARFVILRDSVKNGEITVQTNWATAFNKPILQSKLSQKKDSRTFYDPGA